MSFSLTFFDVRHGDSILLVSPSGGVGIIDSNQVEDRIPALEYIRENDIREIEFICLTHPHFDHYRGMVELIDYCVNNGVQIKNFYLPPISPPDFEFAAMEKRELNYYCRFLKRVADLCSDKPAILRDCSRGSLVYDEAGFSVTAQSPFASRIRDIQSGKYVMPERTFKESYNCFSIVLLVDSGQYKIYLLADSPLDDQRNILVSSRQYEGKIDCFKISHHGSRHYLNKKMVSKFAKKRGCCSVISAGCKNMMPSPQVIKYLSSIGFSTYCTNAYKTTTQKEEEVDLSGLSEGLVEYIEEFTQPVTKWEKVIPYHGDITIEFRDKSPYVKTAVNRPSL